LGFEGDGPADDDVLADSSDEVRPLLLQLIDALAEPLRLRRLEDVLGEAKELLVLRDRLRLAPDRDHGADISGDRHQDDPLLRRRPGALSGLSDAALS